jgi:NTP pyrophosphatase (non-canonical NTP hydrolase)
MFGVTSYERERLEDRIQELENNQEDVIDVINDVVNLLNYENVAGEDFFENLLEAKAMLEELSKGLK